MFWGSKGLRLLRCQMPYTGLSPDPDPLSLGVKGLTGVYQQTQSLGIRSITEVYQHTQCLGISGITGSINSFFRCQVPYMCLSPYPVFLVIKSLAGVHQQAQCLSPDQVSMWQRPYRELSSDQICFYVSKASQGSITKPIV